MASPKEEETQEEELNYIPEFVLSTTERIIEGILAALIIIRGFATDNYLLAILGAEFLLDSTLLKGQGIGQIKRGFSKSKDDK